MVSNAGARSPFGWNCCCDVEVVSPFLTTAFYEPIPDTGTGNPLNLWHKDEAFPHLTLGPNPGGFPSSVVRGVASLSSGDVIVSYAFQAEDLDLTGTQDRLYSGIRRRSGSTGAVVWEHDLSFADVGTGSGVGDGLVPVADVIVDLNDDIYIAAFSSLPSTTHWIRKLDSDGNFLWQVEVVGVASGTALRYLAHDGNFLYVGINSVTPNPGEFKIYKLDSNGGGTSSALITLGGQIIGLGVDGVGGTGTGTGSGSDTGIYIQQAFSTVGVLVRKYDESGVQQWVTTLHSFANSHSTRDGDLSAMVGGGCFLRWRVTSGLTVFQGARKLNVSGGATTSVGTGRLLGLQFESPAKLVDGRSIPSDAIGPTAIYYEDNVNIWEIDSTEILPTLRTKPATTPAGNLILGGSRQNVPS